MPDTRYDRELMDLVGHLAELPADQRVLELDRRCGDDAAMRSQILTLLRELETHGVSGEGLATTGGPAVFPPSPPQELPSGERMGEFQLIRRIGVGGMSEVYEAEQEKPRRRVDSSTSPCALPFLPAPCWEK